MDTQPSEQTDPQNVLDLVQRTRLEMLTDNDVSLDNKEKLALLSGLAKTAMDEQNLGVKKKEVDGGNLVANALASAIMSATIDNPFEGEEIIEGKTVELPDDLLPDVDIPDFEMTTELEKISYEEVMGLEEG